MQFFYIIPYPCCYVQLLFRVIPYIGVHTKWPENESQNRFVIKLYENSANEASIFIKFECKISIKYYKLVLNILCMT